MATSFPEHYNRRFTIGISRDAGRKTHHVALDVRYTPRKHARTITRELQGEAQLLARFLETQASIIFVAELHRALGEILRAARLEDQILPVQAQEKSS